MRPRAGLPREPNIDLTWLGQAGVLIASKAAAVAIDPFFSEHNKRLYPPPADEVLGNRLDYLLATHEHGDHFDVELIRRLVGRFPELIVLVPSPLVPTVKDLVPTAKVKGLQPGQAVLTEGLVIHAVGAIHAIDMANGYSDGRGLRGEPTPFLGYVFKYPSVTIYHAGDTLVSNELIGELATHAVDVAILPSNGRDFFREQAGVAGNLTSREAVEFAAAIGARLLIPIHHDLVRGNTERSGACADIAAELELPVHVLNLARLIPWRLPSDRSPSFPPNAPPVP